MREKEKNKREKGINKGQEEGFCTTPRGGSYFSLHIYRPHTTQNKVTQRGGTPMGSNSIEVRDI